MAGAGGWTANQTWLSKRASPFGRFATGIRSTTRFSAGSMRAMTRENSPLTHTTPAPTATPSGPSPTGIVAVTLGFVPESIRETVPSSEFATHTEPSPNAMPVGPLPTLTVSTTLPRRESMRTTLRLDSSVTQTLPPPTAMPRPSAPVLIGLPESPVAASILVTVCSAALVTQTAPPSTATAVGVTPTGIVWTTRFVCGSIRDTVASNEFATQTPPAPTAIPLGSPPTSMRWTTTRVRGSMRETEPSCAFVTHTDPSPIATLVGPLPTGTVRDKPIRPRVDRRNRMCRNRVESGAVLVGELDDSDGNRRRKEENGADRDQDTASAADLVDRDGGLPRRIELNFLRRDWRWALGRRLQELAVDRLGLGRWVGAELLVEELPALFVDLERLCSVPGGGVRVHEAPVAALAEGLERDCLLGPLGRLRGFAGAQAGVCKAIERAVEDVCQLAALSLDPGSILPGKKR